MATNPYFSQSVRSEQSLFEDIVIESLKMYGQDIYYLPRDIVNEDRILGDDVPSRFNSSYKIEMWIENVDGFDGEGDLFSKFGVEIRDQATFVVFVVDGIKLFIDMIMRLLLQDLQKVIYFIFHSHLNYFRSPMLNMNSHSISYKTYQHINYAVSSSNTMMKTLIQM